MSEVYGIDELIKKYNLPSDQMALLKISQNFMNMGVDIPINIELSTPKYGGSTQASQNPSVVAHITIPKDKSKAIVPSNEKFIKYDSRRVLIHEINHVILTRLGIDAAHNEYKIAVLAKAYDIAKYNIENDKDFKNNTRDENNELICEEVIEIIERKWGFSKMKEIAKEDHNASFENRGYSQKRTGYNSHENWDSHHNLSTLIPIDIGYTVVDTMNQDNFETIDNILLNEREC